MAIHNKPLEHLGLTSQPCEDKDITNSNVLRETNFNYDELSKFEERNTPLLIFDRISSNEGGGIFFLDAPGEAGKTF